MRTYRATISTLTLMMLVLTAGAPATASAGSLLSGYGGPGQGSQSILGTALLGALAPGFVRLHVAGIPLPWVILAVLIYPLLIGLAAYTVRHSEQNERAFTQLVRRR